jgi:PAS domain S-box-containing protein
MFAVRPLGTALCLLAFPLQAVALLAAGISSDMTGMLGWFCGPVVLAAGLALLRRKAPTATLEQEVAHAALRVANGVTLLDEKGFIYANEAALRDLGFGSVDEIRGRTPADLSPERQPDGSASREAAARYVEGAMKDGRATFEWVLRRKDGTAFPVEVTLVSVLVGGQRHLMNYWRDLSQVRRLREKQQKTLTDLADRMDSSVRRVAQTLDAAAATLSGDAQGLTEACGSSREMATAAVSASETANAGAQGITGASEELTASISEITREVERAAQLTGRAAEESRHTDTVVRNLAEGARKIGDVVGLISTIASQTNLLALNAPADGESDRGHFRPDQSDPGSDPECRRGDPEHHPPDRGNQQRHLGHRGRGRAGGYSRRRHRAPCPQHRGQHADRRREHRWGQPNNGHRCQRGGQDVRCRASRIAADRAAIDRGRQLRRRDQGGVRFG